MTPTEEAVEKFERAFETMPKLAKERFLNRLLMNNIYREDIIDMATAQKRKKESTRSFTSVVSEIKKNGK